MEVLYGKRFFRVFCMTLPEYREDCNCKQCQLMRNKERDKQNRQRISQEIKRIAEEHQTPKTKGSTGTDLLEDCFR